MITIRITISWAEPPQTRHPNLPAGLHHIAEIMPQVLDRYGLAIKDERVSERPAMAIDAADLFEVMIACLEAALAG